jgi:hypothetical protein
MTALISKGKQKPQTGEQPAAARVTSRQEQ